MTTEILLDNISSSELAEWQDYYSIEPWPWHSIQLGLANQTSWLVAVQGGKATIEKCLLKFEGPGQHEASGDAWEAWAVARNAGMKGNQ